MAKNQYGMTEWDTPKFTKFNKDENTAKVEFMKLKNGTNTVRIITKPFEYETWLGFKPSENIPEGRSKYGERILSSIFHGKDPLMESPWNLERPTRRWYIGVIDRDTSSYKLLDISSSIFKKLQILNKLKGEPTGYDVTIVKDSNAAPANYYEVIPGDKEPMSASDIELKEQVDLEDIKRRVTPPTYEQVKVRLDKILEICGVDAKKLVAKTSAQKVGNSKTPEGGDDESVDFPSAD